MATKIIDSLEFKILPFVVQRYRSFAHTLMVAIDRWTSWPDHEIIREQIRRDTFRDENFSYCSEPLARSDPCQGDEGCPPTVSDGSDDDSVETLPSDRVPSRRRDMVDVIIDRKTHRIDRRDGSYNTWIVKPAERMTRMPPMSTSLVPAPSASNPTTAPFAKADPAREQQQQDDHDPICQQFDPNVNPRIGVDGHIFTVMCRPNPLMQPRSSKMS